MSPRAQFALLYFCCMFLPVSVQHKKVTAKRNNFDQRLTFHGASHRAKVMFADGCIGQTTPYVCRLLSRRAVGRRGGVCVCDQLQ